LSNVLFLLIIRIENYIRYYLLAVAKSAPAEAVLAAATEFGVPRLTASDFEQVFEHYATKPSMKENIRTIDTFVHIHLPYFSILG